MLLRTECLTKDYGRHRALDGVSFGVSAGEIFGLLGPNGSGKSTALRLFLGFLQPTEGRAWIGGHDCWSESVAARRKTAYLPGELRLYENMTGRQLLDFLSRLRDGRKSSELQGLGLRFDIDLDRPIAALSSGMKRKVALILVLAAHAPLMILDEPTNTLDPAMRDELIHQLDQARQRGQAVLFSSHVLSEVERVCDRVGILHEGRLVHVQSMAELREDRIFHVELARPLESLALGPGLRLRDQSANRLTLEQTGPLAPVLDWLSCQPVVSLRVEPLGLSAIYRRYHESPP